MKLYDVEVRLYGRLIDEFVEPSFVDDEISMLDRIRKDVGDRLEIKVKERVKEGE